MTFLNIFKKSDYEVKALMLLTLASQVYMAYDMLSFGLSNPNLVTLQTVIAFTLVSTGCILLVFRYYIGAITIALAYSILFAKPLMSLISSFV